MSILFSRQVRIKDSEFRRFLFCLTRILGRVAPWWITLPMLLYLFKLFFLNWKIEEEEQGQNRMTDFPAICSYVINRTSIDRVSCDGASRRRQKCFYQHRRLTMSRWLLTRSSHPCDGFTSSDTWGHTSLPSIVILSRATLHFSLHTISSRLHLPSPTITEAALFQ